METRDFLVLAYAAFGSQVRGKTKLQKMVYFLGVMLGRVRELGYVAHYYGPYSPAVADANAELKALGYLDEFPAGGGGVSPGGFEVVRYDYRLNDAGCRLAERKKDEWPDDWSRIQEKAHVIARAGDCDYMELSVAAKAYYILTEHGRKATLEAIREMAQGFGWEIGKQELDRAVAFLQSLGLVTVS